MPVSDLHDGPLEMIRQRPGFLTELLVMRGVPVPEHDLIAPGASDITDPLSRFGSRYLLLTDSETDSSAGTGRPGALGRRGERKKKRVY